MDSSASDSRKEIACTSNFSKLSKKNKTKKKTTEENDYHSCEHFVTYLFYNFSQVLNIQRKCELKVC